MKGNASEPDPEIVDWWVVEHWEKIDYLDPRNRESRKVVEGMVKFLGKTFKFRYEMEWENSNGGGCAKVECDDLELKEFLEDYIECVADELF